MAAAQFDYAVMLLQGRGLVKDHLQAVPLLKTFKRAGGQVWLMPHNPAFDPIPGNEATVLGKVVTVIRKV